MTAAGRKSVVPYIAYIAEPSALVPLGILTRRRVGIESRPEPCERPRVQWCLATPGAPGVFSPPSVDSKREMQVIQPHMGPVLVDVEEQ